MYRSFDLADVSFTNPTGLHAKGTKLKAEGSRVVRNTLDGFLLPGGMLDGTAMQADWFPTVAADVFIAHAHHDEDRALIFAGWLESVFGLRAFVDSCVWGYADDLLRAIDNEYCLNHFSRTYDYQRRNGSTSHVHMMLATALSMMIDRTECAIVMRTANSISSLDAANRTKSPWIYSELATMHTIRRHQPRRGSFVKRADSYGGIDESLQIQYNVTTLVASLNPIDADTLKEWVERAKGRRGPDSLDALYTMVPA